MNELSEVRDKSTQLGMQLGMPLYKIKQFDREDDRLAAIIDYWLRGNVENGPPQNWESIVKILKTGQVDASGLADTISQKYGLNVVATASNAASKSSLPEEWSVCTCCFMSRF